MANPNSNLPAALQNDFLTVPTDAQLQDLKLPDVLDLPYGEQVKNAKLWSVTTRPQKTNPLNDFVPDLFSFTNERAERDLIYQAYERVTGHDDLDPQPELNREGEGSGDGGDNNFTYNIYASALHNGLVDYRQSQFLGGASLYHMTRRLVTYLQDVAPNSYLGTLAGGKWWLAPNCYHIVVYHRPAQNGPNLAPLSYGAVPISAGSLETEQVNHQLYGLDRAQDSARFDMAQFTFHWINIRFYTYADPTKIEEKDAAKADHWGLVIRHAGTNDGYYFDSMFSNKAPDQKASLLQLVQDSINRWLRDSNKTPIGRLQASPNQPVQGILVNDGGWQCGVHTIANVIAFIRCGRLGWHNVPAWRGGNNGREGTMVEQIRVSLHELMGLKHDRVVVKSRIIDPKKYKGAWNKQATKTGRAYKVQTTEQEQAADTNKQNDAVEQNDGDVQTIKTNLYSLRQEVATMKTDLITNLRQELVTVILDQLRPVLQAEIQNLNQTGDGSTAIQPPDLTSTTLSEELLATIGDELRPILQELEGLNQKGCNCSTTSLPSDLTSTTLREELVASIQDEIRPVLQELQNLNTQGCNCNCNTTSQPPPDITTATLRQELGAAIQEELHPVLQQLQNTKGCDCSTTSQPSDLTAATLRQELGAAIQEELRPILQEELQNLNTQVGDASTTSQPAGMTAETLRQELVAFLHDELRPILQTELRPVLQQELQALNLQGGDTSSQPPPPPPDTTAAAAAAAREQALNEREAALNAREQALNREETLNQRENLLNERENDLKRKADELEAAGGEEPEGSSGPPSKKNKTTVHEEEDSGVSHLYPPDFNHWFFKPLQKE